MVSKKILPACIQYSDLIGHSLAQKKNLGLSCDAEEGLLSRISNHMSTLYQKNEALITAHNRCPKEDPLEAATYYRDTILPLMAALRQTADALEMLIGEEYWPLPSYTRMLYSL